MSLPHLRDTSKSYMSFSRSLSLPTITCPFQDLHILLMTIISSTFRLLSYHLSLLPTRPSLPLLPSMRLTPTSNPLHNLHVSSRLNVLTFLSLPIHTCLSSNLLFPIQTSLCLSRLPCLSKPSHLSQNFLVSTQTYSSLLKLDLTLPKPF